MVFKTGDCTVLGRYRRVSVKTAGNVGVDLCVYPMTCHRRGLTRRSAPTSTRFRGSLHGMSPFASLANARFVNSSRFNSAFARMPVT